MKKDKHLSNEELCARYQSGDAEALTELCEQNKGYVWKVVWEYLRKYRYSLAEEDDLVNDGFLGLVTAAQRFDQNSKTGFLTYADSWIRKFIRKDFFQGYHPENPVYSLDEVTGWDDEEGTVSAYERYLADHRWQPEPIALRKLKNEAIRDAVGRLPDREKEYLTRRFGLDGGDPMDRQTTADYYGLRERRADMLEKSAYQHMREEVEGDIWIYRD